VLGDKLSRKGGRKNFAAAIHGETPLGKLNQRRFARLNEELRYKAHHVGAYAPEFPIGTKARKLNGLIK